MFFFIAFYGSFCNCTYNAADTKYQVRLGLFTLGIYITIYSFNQNLLGLASINYSIGYAIVCLELEVWISVDKEIWWP